MAAQKRKLASAVVITAGQLRLRWRQTSCLYVTSAPIGTKVGGREYCIIRFFVLSWSGGTSLNPLQVSSPFGIAYILVYSVIQAIRIRTISSS